MLQFISFIVFISLFAGFGTYFSIQGVAKPFNQVPLGVALLAGLSVGVFCGKDTMKKKIDSVIRGMGDHTILTIVMILALAGAFSNVTQSMGCVDSCTNFILHFIPSYALLPGIFILSAVVSLATGTSMGTLATVSPLAVGFVQNAGLDFPLTLATVIGGSIFGDNLSVISDTTISACQTQGANVREKLKFNAKISFVASIFTLILLFNCFSGTTTIETTGNYTFFQIFPFIFIIALSLCGVDVFIVLVSGIFAVGVLNFFVGEYTLLKYFRAIQMGFYECFEIILLTLFVGGMDGLCKDQGGFDTLITKVEKFCTNKFYANLMIFFIPGLCVPIVSNNTLAILISSVFAKNITQKYNLSPHKTATWVDISACSIKGILPYGSQVLFASSLANTAPLAICKNVYYCYILLGVAFVWICISHLPKKTT